jgi:ferredoxin-fold anticodon binding domain-containing protein
MDELYQQLVTIIEAELQATGKEYTVGKFTGLGWLFPKEVDVPIPAISVKQYAKTVNLYLIPIVNGTSILDEYEATFKKSNMGKGCIRLRNLTADKEKAVRELIRLTQEGTL